MRLDFDLAGVQIDGARDYQEDAFLITHLTDTDGNPSSLVIVADGMGGHAAGNVASNMAVQAFNKHVSSHYPTLAVSTILEEAVDKANLSIRETIEETPALQGMGCTMIGAILEKGKIWWASVGDSHIYLVRESGIAKINQDHSYGGFLDRMEAAGKFIEPDPGLTRNMLMSAVTGEEVNDIDCPDVPRELYPGDRVLICTDGMDTLSSGKILEFVSQDVTPKDCVDSLVKAVTDADMPRQDNTTAVVVRIIGKASDSKPPPPVSPPKVEEDVDELETIGLTGADGTQTFDQEPYTPPEPPQTEQFQYQREPDTGSKINIGTIFSALVLLALACAGAYFFLMKPGSTPSEETSPPVVEIPMEELEPEEMIEEEFDEPEEELELVEEDSAEEVEEMPEEMPEDVPEEDVAVIIPTVVEEFRDGLGSGGNGPTMVKLPAGKFKMGNSNSTRFANEQPVHDVEIKAFAISKHEITYAQYDRFARATGRGKPNSGGQSRDNHPVSNISWFNANEYTKWLSKQTGKQYQLPTEAQWEYAATVGDNAPYPWGFDELPGKAHCFTCESNSDFSRQTRIASFPANAFGLFDMNGNVAEWVQECWHRNYAGAPATGEFWEGGDCAYRSVRGGSFSSPMSSLRSQRRDKFGAKNAYDNIGFRVVRILQ